MLGIKLGPGMIYVSAESGLQDVCFNPESPFCTSDDDDVEDPEQMDKCDFNVKGLVAEGKLLVGEEAVDGEVAVDLGEEPEDGVVAEDLGEEPEDGEVAEDVGEEPEDWEKPVDVGEEPEDGEEVAERGKAEMPEEMSVDDERCFLEYSLAIVEDIDRYFGGKSMEPNFLSWSGDNDSGDLSDKKLARLFYELRPFLPINPLDELTERIAAECYTEVKDPNEVIANGTGRNFFYVSSDENNGLLWKKKKTLPRNESM